MALTASGVSQPVRGREVVDEPPAVVQETGAELLVIGFAKRSAVGELLMGSAAQRILLDVECPISRLGSTPTER